MHAIASVTRRRAVSDSVGCGRGGWGALCCRFLPVLAELRPALLEKIWRLCLKHNPPSPGWGRLRSPADCGVTPTGLTALAEALVPNRSGKWGLALRKLDLDDNPLANRRDYVSDVQTARWVTLRARWVTLRARRVTLRARWVTLRARWVTRRRTSARRPSPLPSVH